jgi:beta-glucosidase
VVIGTTTEWESEAYDRDDLKLPGATDDLVRSILQAVPNAIIVNQSGMPVELPWLDQAPTLFQAFFGGNECGTAIANAIFGKSNPGGKLPVTWPVSLDDYKHVEFGNAVTTVYTEGLNVGYRWFDAPGRPKSAFPFGFGGSYTTFQFRFVTRSYGDMELMDSNLKLTSSGNCKVVVAFDVKNTGKLAGSTVGQVYVHQARPSVEKPDVELAGFAKMYLEPGETGTTSVTLDVGVSTKSCSLYADHSSTRRSLTTMSDVCAGSQRRAIMRSGLGLPPEILS